MLRNIAIQQATLLTALVWAACGSGCAGHRVPAIDPSGEHIFSGAATAVVSPIAECPLLHPAPRQPAAVMPTCPPVVPVVPAVPAMPVASCPQPLAVVAQPIPQPAPACPPPRVAPPAAAACPRPPGPLLTVTPKEIVAPVCSEVIVAAGLCDARGYYLTGQPLEWMIPAGSIGEIVQVGKETHTGFTSYLRGSPHKVGINYVRAYTSSIAQTIDRGTPTPLDDVSLGKGQSWISVTSPAEGTTHVSVWAPKEKDWERRRTTARIHWVDAKWTFPPPLLARFGQPARLTTRIMRSNGAPVAGWIVRYDVVGGPEASFGAAGQKSVALPTDASGAATVELVPNTTTPGITQVRVQIVRPSTGRDGLGEMIVGQGLTSVTWSSPGLQVNATGPESVLVDGTINYRIEVVNSGDLPARDVRLSFIPPRSVTVLSSTPQASPLGQTLAWRLGDLRPRSAAVVQINCRATMVADIRAAFRAESAEKISAEAVVSTRVFASGLSIRMTGPETAQVGQTAQFRIELTNTSRSVMTNVRVRDTYDPGLSEVEGKRSPLELDYPQIVPGETKQFAVTFTLNEPGKQCHRVTATAEGGHTAAASGCVTGVAAGTTPPRGAPSPQVSIDIKVPRQIEVGKSQVVQIEINNRAATALNNVRLEIGQSASLEATNASGGVQQTDEGTIYWLIPQLRAGAREMREVEFAGAQANPRASVSATVTSDQTEAQTKDATVPVVAPAVTPPMGTKGPPTGSKTSPMGAKAAPPAANANNLKISLGELADTVKAGSEVTYLLEIANTGMHADSDVVLTFTFPADFRTVTFGKQIGALQSQSLGGGRYEVLLPDRIEPGKKFGPLSIKATATKAGTAVLRLNVKSALNPLGIDDTEETTITPAP